MTSKNTILPSGFYDRLFDEAEAMHRLNNQLLEHVMQAGYRLLQPSVIEYSKNDGSFAFHDTIADKWLALRQDITPQIMRLATERLQDTLRPLKCCYSGEVVRPVAKDNIPDRQVRQMGVEYIGAADAVADVETLILLATEAVATIGLQDVVVDISIPKIAQDIMGKELPIELQQAIQNKEQQAIKQYGNTLLGELAMLSGDTAILPQLTKQVPNNELINNLATLSEKLDAQKINYVINPLECHNFGYYSGISFGFYSPKSHEMLGCGGWYDMPNGENGVGFSLHINALTRIL